MIRRRVVVRGLVQGVGFRYSLQRLARTRGVAELGERCWGGAWNICAPAAFVASNSMPLRKANCSTTNWVFKTNGR